ncbi:CaiB/BaiF CoA transferase family protein [Neobacillus sp. NRS-1170]|uniref:CaiB/BaiF CoA transferase family protein n=1 Tax=Neobacillus sp. NRS-1170 TaxID=3233898 RepID=UPI003D290B22
MSSALTSLRILDLTRLLPGPYCTMLLADYGAEVIKIEDTGLGDYVRANSPKIGENSALFHSVNRNKKSVCLNLKTDKGKEIFLKMAENADVVVESFRPGVMDRLGVGYDVLKKINPTLVYCALTGYGQTGPYANKPGHDLNYISYAGLLEFIGERNRKPIVPPIPIADIGGGALLATVGILMALFQRERSGKGQFVDISMMDGALSWLQLTLPDYFVTNIQPNRGELRLSGRSAFYEVYETKDGRYLSVGAVEAKFWEQFCKVIGREEFIHQQHVPMDEQDRIKAEIQAIISTKAQKEWVEIFSKVDACVTPVNKFEDLETDPQLIEREMIQTFHDSEIGPVKLIAPPIKMSETPGSIRKLAPKSGKHTAEILAQMGYSNQEIEALTCEGVISGALKKSPIQ